MENNGYNTVSNESWIKRNRFLLIILTIPAIIIILTAVISIKGRMLKAEKLAAQSQGQPPVNVITLQLTPQTIHDRINLPGIIEPWVKLDVKAEVNARVMQKIITKGDTVKRGDIIAKLDSRTYENEFKSSKASYEASLASLNRMKNLHKEELSTASQLENAQAQAEKYKAEMDNAKKDLENCIIKAPISGIVNHLYIEEGQYLTVAANIAEILQTEKVKVIVGIPESDVNAVRSIQHFDIRIDALDNKLFQGTSYFLSQSADPMARLYNLEIMIDNSSGEILPDMFARVEIIKSVIDNCIVVPLYALVFYNQKHIVYVENNGIAQLRHVEPGIQEGDFIRIVKGLAQDEQLIVVGHRSVSDGQKVNVTNQITDPKELSK